MRATPEIGSAPRAAAMRTSRVVGIAAAVFVLAAGAFLALRPDATVQASPTRIECRSGSLLYVLHPLTLDEQLFDLSAEDGARRDILLLRPDEAERLRLHVIRELEIESIEELRADRNATRERLRALGYL